jgi:hypothetical protein
MMEALSSSETSVLTSATWRNNPEDAIFHSHCHENLMSYLRRDILQSTIHSVHPFAIRPPYADHCSDE